MRWLPSVTLTIVSILFTTLPGIAAESIILPLGKTTISISIDSLENYANQGTINPKESLATYLKLLSPGQQQTLLRLLKTRYTNQDISIQPFFNSPLILAFLSHLGNIIQTQSGDNGVEAIHTSLIKVSNTPNGFTIIDVMRQFPSPEIRLDIEQTLEILTQVFTLIQQTQTVTQSLEILSKIEAKKADFTDFSKIPDLRELGIFKSIKKTITVNNPENNRNFEVDIYLPDTSISTDQNLTKLSYPVIVISHGLASDRSRFENLARHLTSYGFAVAVPQHPGSDYQQFQLLLKGEVKDLFEPEQFIDRPKDITALLNHLEKLNSSDFNDQLDLQNVGVVGHSLGGYTALTLAGATLDFTQLKTDCQQSNIPLNPSIFLQCRALELPEHNYNLQDSRVKAIFILNPVNSIILGKSGLSKIKIPVFITASNADFLAPALSEQLQSFTWLTTPQKYLMMQNHATHFYDITQENTSELSQIPQFVPPTSEISRYYVKALSTAFFKTYLNQDSQYKPYLNAAYIQNITDPAYPISLIQSLTPNQLNNAIKGITPDQN
jgi:Predicted dienelactone hydrolase